MDILHFTFFNPLPPLLFFLRSSLPIGLAGPVHRTGRSVKLVPKVLSTARSAEHQPVWTPRPFYRFIVCVAQPNLTQQNTRFRNKRAVFIIIKFAFCQFFLFVFPCINSMANNGKKKKNPKGIAPHCVAFIYRARTRNYALPQRAINFNLAKQKTRRALNTGIRSLRSYEI